MSLAQMGRENSRESGSQKKAGACSKDHNQRSGDSEAVDVATGR